MARSGPYYLPCGSRERLGCRRRIATRCRSSRPSGSSTAGPKPVLPGNTTIRARRCCSSTTKAKSSNGTPRNGSTGRSTSSREPDDTRRRSQFMHREQGALIATAKIVQTVPDLDSKFYAATQVMDEARHVEAYSRFLHEKFELAYPITHGLKSLLDQGLSDSRWDMTYLTIQILIEGLALAAFQRIRDQSKNPLAAAVNAYVMQDEARHVAFGRIALRDYYPQLSDAERNEREEFVVDACWHMRDRFNQLEVWQRLGLPVDDCLRLVDQSEAMNVFRSRIFSRIVPTVRDIGLWGPRVQQAFAAMGAIEFATVDAAAVLDSDARVADEFDARLRVRDAMPQ